MVFETIVLILKMMSARSFIVFHCLCFAGCERIWSFEPDDGCFYVKERRRSTIRTRRRPLLCWSSSFSHVGSVAFSFLTRRGCCKKAICTADVTQLYKLGTWLSSLDAKVSTRFASLVWLAPWVGKHEPPSI